MTVDSGNPGLPNGVHAGLSAIKLYFYASPGAKTQMCLKGTLCKI